MAFDKLRNNLVESLTFGVSQVKMVMVVYHLNKSIAEKIADILPFTTVLVDAVNNDCPETGDFVKGVSHIIEVYYPDKIGYDKCKQLRQYFWKHNRKVLSLFDWQETYLDDEFWSDSDYGKMSHDIENFSKQIAHAENFRITSELGTDISFSVKGRKWLTADGMCRCAGHFAQMPDGEAYTCPVEETFTGIIVVDGTVTRSWVPSEPQRLEFNRGRLVDCSKEFNEYIKGFPEEIRTIGEFAIGLNPGVSEIMANISVDEKAAGTVHFALGDSYGLGINKCDCHIDFVVREPIIHVEPYIKMPFER